MYFDVGAVVVGEPGHGSVAIDHLLPDYLKPLDEHQRVETGFKEKVVDDDYEETVNVMIDGIQRCSCLHDHV